MGEVASNMMVCVICSHYSFSFSLYYGAPDTYDHIHMKIQL